MSSVQFNLKTLFGLTFIAALGCLIVPRVGTPAFWIASGLAWLAVAIAVVVSANSSDDKAR